MYTHAMLALCGHGLKVEHTYSMDGCDLEFGVVINVTYSMDACGHMMGMAESATCSMDLYV